MAGFRVTWTNSSVGTQPINNNVQYRTTGSGTFTDNALGTTTGATQDLTGLAAGTGYDIRIKAANLAGVVFSAQIQATTEAAPSGTQTITGTQSFTDSSGVVWTISTAERCAYNGTEDLATGSVIEMALVNGNAIWQLNSAGNWYSKTATASPVQNSWANGTNPLPPPSATVFISAGQTPAAFFIDASNIVWSISTGAQILFNGVTDTSTANASQMATTSNGTLVWHKNTSNIWYRKAATGTPVVGGWVQQASPPV